MTINFKLSEFNITGQPIPEAVADKILLYHITPMQTIRDIMGIPIWPSEKNGYRPMYWEKQNRRSGNSEHVFKGRGAANWTCTDFPENKDTFLDLIIKHTEYTRIAVYDTFVHTDYKPTKSGKRELYISNNKSEWKFSKFVSKEQGFFIYYASFSS